MADMALRIPVGCQRYMILCCCALQGMMSTMSPRTSFIKLSDLLLQARGGDLHSPHGQCSADSGNVYLATLIIGERISFPTSIFIA